MKNPYEKKTNIIGFKSLLLHERKKEIYCYIQTQQSCTHPTNFRYFNEIDLTIIFFQLQIRILREREREVYVSKNMKKKN